MWFDLEASSGIGGILFLGPGLVVMSGSGCSFLGPFTLQALGNNYYFKRFVFIICMLCLLLCE